MALRSAIINVMSGAAEKAAKSLLRDFGEVEQLQVSRKGPADFVSAADLNAEKIIKAELAKARPEYGFLMEESGTSPSTNHEQRGRWIVDPLDGTTNFLHGLPHWAISIALEAEGQIVAGIIYDPVKNELFTTERGGGAFLNSKRLRVSARTTLSDSMIATGIPVPARSDVDTRLAQIGMLAKGDVTIRRQGSAALDLAYVAAGRYDGYWESAIHPWDVAAGVLLVLEAGGYVTDYKNDGDPVYAGAILAANTAIHGLLTPLLKQDAATANYRMQAGNDRT